MPARRCRRPGRCTGPASSDAGFTLIEVLVSIILVGIVMSALATFYATASSAVGRQTSGQVAAQLAIDGIERARSVKGSALFAGRDKTSTDNQWADPVTGVAPYLADVTKTWDADAAYPAGATAPLPTTARTATVSGVAYGQNWYLGTCRQPAAGGDCGHGNAAGSVEFVRVVVAVTWSERHCTNSACSYVTSTLISNATRDPTFNANQAAQAPTVTNPGNQVSTVGAVVSLQVSSSGGAPPLTWTATGLPAGLSISSSGLITGTPTTSGTYSVTVTVTDSFALVGSAGFSWTVSPAPAVAGVTNQSTSVGAAVSLAPSATGGTAPLTWSVTAPGPWGTTGLPPGLSINASTGRITGTPTTAGPARNVTVRVTDRVGAAATRTFTWTVTNASPSITGVAAAATRTDAVNAMVDLQATATGGVAPYTWSATNLPAGLKITTAGRVSGKLTTGTRYLTKLTVKDKKGMSKATNLDWRVSTAPGGLQVAFPVGDRTGDRVRIPTAVVAVAAGGSGTGYKWTVSGLPPGMTLIGSGVLSGSPTKAGAYTVRLTVTDSKKKTAVFMFTWTIQ